MTRTICAVCGPDISNDTPDGTPLTICRRCRPKARRLLEALQLEIDTYLLDPADIADPRVSGYRVLCALLDAPMST